MKNYLLILAIILFPNFGFSQNESIIIAHRGASYDAPENTLSSVNLAWQKNADAVEIDIHLTLDHKIIVMHDKNTKRTSGENMEIASTTFAELSTLDVGKFKSPKYAGEKIPLLSEVIETIPENKKLFIEVKCGKEIIPYLKKEIKLSGKEKNCTIISFDKEVVMDSKKQMPDIPAYWLHYTLLGKYSEKHIVFALESNLDGLNLRFKGLDKDFISKCHEKGLKVFTWTVDDPKEAVHLINMGINGITSNRPQWIKGEIKTILNK